MIWVILLVVFFLLSLGPVIEINGQPLALYWTPYRLLLTSPLEPIFVALRVPFRFQLLFLICFSILFAHGWQVIASHFRIPLHRTIATISILVIIVVEVSLFPLDRLESNIPSSYEYIRQRAESGGLIHMPSGRFYNKFYMYAQVFHHQPIAEGMTARMPPDAFEYVELNQWLTYIRFNAIDVDLSDLINNWDRNIQVLLNHGFRYVMVYEDVPGEYVPLIPKIPPIYRDALTSVYDLQAIQENPPSQLSQSE